jgi:hypothetical protein
MSLAKREYIRLQVERDTRRQRHDTDKRRHQFPWFWFLITCPGGCRGGEPGELLVGAGNGKFKNGGIYVEVY